MTEEPIDRGNPPTEDVEIPTSQKPIERIHWSELYRGGKHYGTTNSAMLRGDVVIRKECRVDGENHHAGKALREVIYDKEFVINQLAVGNRFILTDCLLEEWIEVCEQAYYQFNEPPQIKIVEEKKPTKRTRRNLPRKVA